MKKLLSILLLGLVASGAFAQGLGAGKLVPIVLFSGKQVASTTAAVTTTNSVTDNHNNNGLAMVIWTWTNTVSTVGSPSGPKTRSCTVAWRVGVKSSFSTFNLI